MTTKLVPLTLALVRTDTAERLRLNALAVSKKGGGTLPQSRSSAASDVYYDYEENIEVRARLASHVAQTNDPILSILFAHPDGLKILREFDYRGARAGQEMALNTVYSAGTALSDLYSQLTAEPIGLWRAPRLIWLAAEAEGLADIPDLKLFLTAIGGLYLDDETGRWVTFASVAFGLLAAVFAPPVGVGVLSTVLAGLSLGAGTYELYTVARADRDQNLAADATGFEVEEARLGAHGWGSTALAGAMLLLAAIFFFIDVAAIRAARGAGPKKPPPPGGRWASPAKEASATTPSSAATTRPPSGSTPSATGAPPGPPGPKNASAEPPPATGSPSATTPRATGGPGDTAPPGGSPKTPPDEAQAVGASSTPSMPPATSPDQPTIGRSVPAQPSVERGPHAAPDQPTGAASGPQRGTTDPPPRRNAGLSGARGTSSDAVEAERKATQLLRQVLDKNPGQDILQQHIRELIQRLRALPDPRAAAIADRFELIREAMSDPELIACVIGRVRAEMDLVRGLGPPTALETEAGLITNAERAIARLDGWTEETAGEVRPLLGFQDDFYEGWVQPGGIIIDRSEFALNDFHGKMSHAFQDLVVDAALERKCLQMTGREWRRSLADPELSPEVRDLQKQLWEEIFDNTSSVQSQGDIGSLNRPETLNPILDEVLGGLLPDRLARRR
jgi:hypothetical protein